MDNSREVLKNLIRYIVPLVLVPAIIAIGAIVFKEKYVAFIIMGVTVASLLLLINCFENRKTGVRRLVVIAIMTALAVVSRFIPILKPVSAITIISAIYLGPESGFLVGAMTAVISNFAFGQGPWTPFQMFSWGIIGLLAGLLGKLLKKSRVALLVFGALTGMIYSFLMDIWTVLWSNTFTVELYIGALISAIPYTISYMIANILFLLLLTKPLGEKLQRIIVKYGI